MLSQLFILSFSLLLTVLANDKQITTQLFPLLCLLNFEIVCTRTRFTASTMNCFAVFFFTFALDKFHLAEIKRTTVESAIFFRVCLHSQTMQQSIDALLYPIDSNGRNETRKKVSTEGRATRRQTRFSCRLFRVFN